MRGTEKEKEGGYLCYKHATNIQFLPTKTRKPRGYLLANFPAISPLKSGYLKILFLNMRTGKEHFLIRKLGAIKMMLVFFAESRITLFLSHLGAFTVHATICRCSHDLGTKQAVGAVKSLTEPRRETQLFRVLDMDRLMAKLYAQ
jgi:hypothetical protein